MKTDQTQCFKILSFGSSSCHDFGCDKVVVGGL